MSTLYNIGIIAYVLAIRIAAPFHKKASLWVKGRKNIWNKIEAIDRGNKRLVWFHAASLGEFEQGRPVMEALKQKEPETQILLTFFSPSGYEIRKNYDGADHVLYLPADTPANARRFVEILRPDAAVFVKYEYWYNYLKQLHQHQTPTYVISAIFRKSQPFFKPWGSLHRKMLGFFTRIYVQDEQSVELLQSIHVSQVEQAGDTRFDRVWKSSISPEDLDKVERFRGLSMLAVCGSTWPADEDLLMTYINAYSGDFKWVIAPHEIGENHLQSIIAKCKKTIVRYTDDDADFEHADVLLMDCIGLLSSVYRYGRIAYIGGGFGAGIHNVLEAAVYSMPVIFGIKYKKFKEAVDLVKEHGAFSIGDIGQLTEVLNVFTQSFLIRNSIGLNAIAYVERQTGATNIIIQELTQTQ